MRIDDPLRPWVPADRTDISKRFREAGFRPPSEDEGRERYEAAYRCMRRIQEEWKNVTPLRRRT